MIISSLIENKPHLNSRTLFGVSLVACVCVFTSGCALTQNGLNLSGTILSAPEKSKLSTASELRNQGAQLAAQEKDAEAIVKFEKAKELSPKLKGVAHPLAVLYDRNGNWNAARREYNQALRETPQNADLLNDYGYFLYSQNELHEAENQLRQCLEIDPSHNKAHVNLGLVLASRDDYAGAFLAFKTAVGAAAAHQNIGLLQAQKGQTELAIASLQKAMQFDSSLKLSADLISRLSDSSQTGSHSTVQQVSHEQF